MSLLIHPGFHKTATTWLQEAVFADQRIFRSLFNHEQIDELLVRPHDFEFDPAAANTAINSKRTQAADGIIDVLSSEILSGNILFGSRDSFAIADRIGTAIKDAKVLLTVRAQLPIAKSIYVQYLKRGGRLGIKNYLAYRPEPGYFWFEPRTLEFDRVASAYARHYGDENVLVLPQELLRKDRSEFLRLLFKFAGVDPSLADGEFENASARGVSPPASAIPFMRMGNALGRTTLNPSPPSVINPIGSALKAIGNRWKFGDAAADKRMKQSIAAALKGRYGESNARLQKFAPVDLAALGYEMA